MARKGFDIFVEDLTQTIYENYLGIFGMMEMWVASQPRANRFIPLIEKGIFPRKRILGLVKEGNDKVLGWFRGWQATREEKLKGDPSGLQNHHTTEKQNRTKIKEKENG